MAITWQTPGAAAYSAINGTSVAPAYPAGSVENDKLLLFVGMKPSTANSGSVTTPSGWNLVTSITGAGGYGTTLGADTGNTNLFVYERTVPAGGLSGTLTVTVATNNVCWAFIARATAASGQWEPIVGTTGSDTTAGNVSVTFAANPGVTANDLIVAAMCIPTDVTTPGQFSAQAFSQAGVTFGTVTEINEPDSTTGNDIGGMSCYSIVSSGTSTGVPTLTATAGGTTTNVRGPAVFIRVRETPLAAITGTFSSTETGTDSFASQGGPVITGSFSSSEAGLDSFSSGGDVVVTGTAALQESTTDSLAASGNVIVTGSIAVTETTIDSFAGDGDVIVAGNFVSSETGVDSFASNGNVVVTGNFAISESGTDTFSASGAVTDALLARISWLALEMPYVGAILGSFTATESQNDSFAATGSVPAAGSLAVSETGEDVLASSGQFIVTGNLASQEIGEDSFSAAGKVYVTGSLSSSETANDSFSAAGVISIAGSANIIEATNDTFSSAGDTFISGNLASTETGYDSFVSDGKIIVSGSVSVTETTKDLLTGDFYVTSGYVQNGYVNEAPRGKVLVQGAASLTEVGSDSFAASGLVFSNVARLQVVETTVDSLTASGKVYIIGTANSTESISDSSAIVGKVLVTGSSAANEVGSDSAVVSGQVVVAGSASITEIGLDEIVSEGKILVNGSLIAVEAGNDSIEIVGSGVVSERIGTLAATEAASDSYSSYPAWIEDIGPRTWTLSKDSLAFSGSQQDDLGFSLQKDALAIEIFSKYS